LTPIGRNAPDILPADAPRQPQHQVRHIGDPPAALLHLARLALTGPGPREWCAKIGVPLR
jgi:hypothetical protein